MNGPESNLEDRLRDHYRHLRDPQSTHQTPRRASSLLSAAACLAFVLMAGGAYIAIRNSDSGQPVETDIGTMSQDQADEPADPLEVPPTEPSEADQTTTTTESGPPTSQDDDASIVPSGSPTVDGSPKAPIPGTVAPPDDAELALAYGIWTPSEHDTCSKAIHDKYWVYGPDNKVYPTWHPPIDPATGCTFGHEHGRDPAGSDLADIPFPFGYANEQAMSAGVGDPQEDHVGHKIEWYNNGGYYERESPNTNHDQICDVAYKLHMDTHSEKAFANNAHEVFLYARCENGSELIYRALHTFGNRGEFSMHCDQTAGPTVTLDQQGTGDSDAGSREIPASQCFEDEVLVPDGQRSNWFPFDERWTLYQSIDSQDFGRFFIQFQFFADIPSRYWDGEKLVRTVDLCYSTGERQVRDDEFCEPMRNANPDRRVQWDDPASPFNGADRQVFMSDIQVDNNLQQTDWYTDVYGRVWSAEPFTGSIRQHVGTTPIHAAASYRPDPIRSISFADDLGLHAPN